MKHKLKATITFEYEVDSDYYDPCDLHNVIKTDLIEAKEGTDQFILIRKDFDTVYDISIEPVKE